MALWLAQLVLNFFWSFFFFGMHAIGVALLDLSLLWVAILVTMITFWRIDRPAGWLFAPYFAWVSFASLLNATILMLNG